MWKCLYVYRVLGNRALPYVGLYRNTGDNSLQVVRFDRIENASYFQGAVTGTFLPVRAARPRKVFRTIFLTEGDPEFTLLAVDSTSTDDVPDLGLEELRRQDASND